MSGMQAMSGMASAKDMARALQGASRGTKVVLTKGLERLEKLAKGYLEQSLASGSLAKKPFLGLYCQDRAEICFRSRSLPSAST